tara:strand:+ start:429 stop:731 length:303 start_codon:yes stop_codon:yes gene_type:complete
VVDDEITPHTILTADKLEPLLDKEREKYMKIINNLTDQIKKAGCDLDHPFDRESMCITNTLANNLLNIINTTEARLRNAYTTNKISKFEYEFILQGLKKD